MCISCKISHLISIQICKVYPSCIEAYSFTYFHTTNLTQIREAFKHDPSGESINKESVLKPVSLVSYFTHRLGLIATQTNTCNC